MNKATTKSSPTHVSHPDYIKLGVLSHIESRFIPPIPTKGRLLLEMLSNGQPHSTQELTLKLGSDPRSPRHRLANNTYGYWHIINVAGKSKQGKYQLDPRHLLRLYGDDSRARAEAEVTYLERSAKGANSRHVKHDNSHKRVREAKAKQKFQLNLCLEIS